MGYFIDSLAIFVSAVGAGLLLYQSLYDLINELRIRFRRGAPLPPLPSTVLYLIPCLLLFGLLAVVPAGPQSPHITPGCLIWGAGGLFLLIFGAPVSIAGPCLWGAIHEHHITTDWCGRLRKDYVGTYDNPVTGTNVAIAEFFARLGALAVLGGAATHFIQLPGLL